MRIIFKYIVTQPFILLSIVLLFGSSTLPAETKTKIPLKIYVSISPQEFFVKAIGGSLINVEALVDPGQSPATYEPTPQQMAGLSDADIYFRIGVPFENRLINKISKMFPELAIIDTREGIQLREIESHKNQDGHHHSRESPDPHIWLDPVLVEKQAEIIFNTLIKYIPEYKDSLEYRLNQFSDSLDVIHNNINNMLKHCRTGKFFVFHPTFGYFADRYGLDQVAIETEGKEPNAKDLSELIELAKNEKIKTIFVQLQFSTKSAEAIAKEIDAKIVVIDPLSRDYFNNLIEIADKIAKGLNCNE